MTATQRIAVSEVTKLKHLQITNNGSGPGRTKAVALALELDDDARGRAGGRGKVSLSLSAIETESKRVYALKRNVFFIFFCFLLFDDLKRDSFPSPAIQARNGRWWQIDTWPLSSDGD